MGIQDPALLRRRSQVPHSEIFRASWARRQSNRCRSYTACARLDLNLSYVTQLQDYGARKQVCYRSPKAICAEGPSLGPDLAIRCFATTPTYSNHQLHQVYWMLGAVVSWRHMLVNVHDCVCSEVIVRSYSLLVPVEIDVRSG